MRLLVIGGSGNLGRELVAQAASTRQQTVGTCATRDGLDAIRLPAGLRTESNVPGPVVVRLDGRRTQSKLSARLRGAREFLQPQ